jgi:hypothetical protein
MFGGLLPFRQIVKFKIGEGGWVFDPLLLVNVPRAPDPGLTDLDIVMDTARILPDKRYNVGDSLGYFEKSMVLLDFVYEFPSTLKSSCLLTFIEYNTKDAGTLVYDAGGPYGPPQIYEIGMFDQNNVMVAYGTFPLEVKTGANQIENIIRISF